MSETIDVNARAKALVDRLWGDKTVGKQVRATAKELFPDAVIPDDPTEQAIAPLMEELETLKAQLAERDAAAAEAAKKALEDKAEADFLTKFEQAAKSFNLSDAGREAVKERMRETGNYTDPEAAAAFVLRNEKPVETGRSNLGPQVTDLFNRQGEDQLEYMKRLWADPDGAFLDHEIDSMLADPRDYVAKNGRPSDLRAYDEAMGL